MKLTSVFIVTILTAFIFVTGCKQKANNELIVKKWRFADISGADAVMIPDTMKKEMYKTATMEFKKDGTYEQAGGMKSTAQKGTYTLSADGKSIISKREGAENGDTVLILELTESKLVVTPNGKGPGKDVKLTLKPN